MIKNSPVVMHGIGLGSKGTCTHYHKDVDIAGLLCGRCEKYYACFKCHDELTNHSFAPSSTKEGHPVLCGSCLTLLTYIEYQEGACVNCKAPFNPGCALHKNLYFCS
ncbi:hypothetical protein G6R29_03160 [Fructobacillus sp. M2-14]|uniref:CHY-type domain-containing protein n=2 Tax=Fructobacillus broussonetiae TaxID=2713173 RepID=A0ABS5R094_9LACO|nr:hypothetical protein [Fructobacillus broussonetiae]